jgi:PAS domain S-box-containing protein
MTSRPERPPGPRPRKARRNDRPRRAAMPGQWETRLAEMELRQTRLEMENSSLREECTRLEHSLAGAAKLHNLGSIGMATFDAHGSILDLNDTTAAFLDGSRYSLLGHSFASQLQPEDAPRFLAHLRRARRIRGSVVDGFRLIGGHKKPEFVELATMPIFDANSKWLRFEAALVDVSVRKRVEAELKLSEETLRALVESSPHPIQFKDASGRWLMANGAALEVFDLTGADYRFKTDQELATQYPLCRLALELRQGGDHVAQQRGKLLRLNEVVFNRDGSTRVFDVLRVPLVEAGQPKGLVVLGYDITDRQLVEEKLRRAYEELEHRVRERTSQLQHTLERVNDLYHNAPCGYHSLDEDGIYVDINNTELEWLGYERSQIVGKKNTFELQTPRSQVTGKEVFHRLIAEGSVRDVELEFIRKDGSILPVLLTASAIHDASGKFLRSRSAIVDITDRKQAEWALRESESRLQAILDNTPAMIFLKDIRGRYLHFNREFSRVFHLSLADAIGKTDAEISPFKKSGPFISQDSRVIENNAPVQFDEVSMQDDGEHTSIVTKFPIYDHEGKIHGIGGIVTDITERKRLEEEVLRVSEREQRRIAQDLHDGVGQQLAGAWCLSEMLRRDLQDKTAVETEKADQISKLLKVTLAQTRSLARGLHPVLPEANGLMSALEDFAGSMSEVFKVPCHFRCQQPVLIENNEVATHLYRIAQEAVTNAMKHAKAREIKIELSSTRRGVTLSVADDGVGYQTKRRSTKGMGLRIMNYRANIIGGTLTLGRSSQGGTEIICNLSWPDTTKPIDETLPKRLQTKKTQKGLHRRRPSRLS